MSGWNGSGNDWQADENATPAPDPQEPSRRDAQFQSLCKQGRPTRPVLTTMICPRCMHTNLTVEEGFNLEEHDTYDGAPCTGGPPEVVFTWLLMVYEMDQRPYVLNYDGTRCIRPATTTHWESLEEYRMWQTRAEQRLERRQTNK